MRALLILVLLAACARPLTPGETALLAPIHGPTLDTGAVRVAPAPGLGLFPITYDARPRVTCRERIAPPPDGPRVSVRTGGLVLYQTLLLRPHLAFPDFAAEADGAIDLGAAMFLAHEMTHVWQWQNRNLTGYSPAKALTEQVTIDDPYLIDPDDPRAFLDFGYEQQAAIVEEFLCCATLDPGAARTGRLHGLLSAVMPVAPPAAFPRKTILWAGAKVRGICS